MCDTLTRLQRVPRASKTKHLQMFAFEQISSVHLNSRFVNRLAPRIYLTWITTPYKAEDYHTSSDGTGHFKMNGSLPVQET